MSVYHPNPAIPTNLVSVGWSKELSTYFISVVDTMKTEDDRFYILYQCGTEPHEIVRTDLIIEQLTPWVSWDRIARVNLTTALTQDMIAHKKTKPTPLNKNDLMIKNVQLNARPPRSVTSE